MELLGTLPITNVAATISTGKIVFAETIDAVLVNTASWSPPGEGESFYKSYTNLFGQLDYI